MRFFPSYILAMALSATVARAADGTTFSLRASPADFVIEPVDVGVAIRYSGAAGAVPRGAPDLPVLVKLLPGVHGKQARALIEAAEFEEVSGIEVAPAGSEDASIYSKDAYWPAEPVEIQEAYQGTKKYVRVAIHPAQYNPVRGILRIYSVLDVRVVHAPGVDPGSASLALQEPAGPPPVAFAEGLDVCDACPDALDSLLPPMNGAAGDFAARRAGAEVEAAWRIGVTNKGVYRVTRAAMTNSGIAAADIMGDSLRLYCRSQEVAITTSTAGLFGPDDYFLFYGLGNDGYYSDTNVYWLGFEPGGKRMATRDAAPIGGAANVTSHCARIRIDPYESYRSAYQPQRDNEHWFAANLTGGASRDYAFATLDPVVGEAAELFFHFHGLDGTGNATTSGIPKNTRIAVSLTTVTNVTYPGESETNGTVTFSSSLLVDGSTTVRLTQTLAGPTRQMYLDELTLRYPRDLAAVSDRLCFPGEAGTNNYVIQEFSTNNNLVVLDVTDHGNPVSLTNFTVASSAGGYALTFGDQPSQAACYLALHTNEVKNIASLDQVWQVSGL